MFAVLLLLDGRDEPARGALAAGVTRVGAATDRISVPKRAAPYSRRAAFDGADGADGAPGPRTCPSRVRRVRVRFPIILAAAGK